MSEIIKPPSEKFIQTLSYVISETTNRPRVGKTLLFKLLYFSDFDYYELNEALLTGERYRSITRGPAPVHFDRAISTLKARREVREKRVTNGPYAQVKYESLRVPNSSLLSAEEKAHIDKIIRRFSRMTASSISKLVHEDLPVKATNQGDLIDPELVFYRDSNFSVRKYSEESNE